MLKKLLDYMKTGEFSSLQALASALDIEVEALRSQLEVLEREGYVRRRSLIDACQTCVRGTCSGGCASCPWAGARKNERSIAWEVVKGGVVSL